MQSLNFVDRWDLDRLSSFLGSVRRQVGSSVLAYLIPGLFSVCVPNRTCCLPLHNIANAPIFEVAT